MPDKYGLEHMPTQEGSSITPSCLIALGRKDAAILSPPRPVSLMNFDFLTLDFDRGDIEAGDISDVMGKL